MLRGLQCKAAQVVSLQQIRSSVHAARDIPWINTHKAVHGAGVAADGDNVRILDSENRNIGYGFLCTIWVRGGATIPVQRNAFLACIVDVCVVRARDGEERLEDVASENAVLIVCAVVRHQIDDEVMGDGWNEAGEGRLEEIGVVLDGEVVDSFVVVTEDIESVVLGAVVEVIEFGDFDCDDVVVAQIGIGLDLLDCSC